MIRKAKLGEIPTIMEIVGLTIEIMHSEGNFQWDSTYPTIEMLEQDIISGNLIVYCDRSGVLGFVCVDQNIPIEYKILEWSSLEESSAFHRMAVNPNYRRMGIASKLIENAEKMAKKRGSRFIVADTFSKNNNMNNLFAKSGYISIGKIKYNGYPGSYFCYEKKILN